MQTWGQIAVPGFDSTDFHFSLQTVTTIQDYSATAQLVSTSKHSIFPGRKLLQVLLKDTSPVLEIVTKTKLNIFKCFILF